MKKSFKLLLNINMLSEKTYEFIRELEAITQIENGHFVYDEEDEEKLRNILDKYSPLNKNNNKKKL